tara:strand:+ start:1842 stop:2210 length:369 start_codon:yes stop_codon:yes gene_type:complete
MFLNHKRTSSELLELPMSTEETVPYATSIEEQLDAAPAAEPKKAAPKKPRINKNQLIINIADEPQGVRKETKRARNMLVVMQSRTVGEALDRLAELPSAGSSADIWLAVKKGVIRLEMPPQE